MGYLPGLNRSKTHYQRMCPKCGLWTIWVHKKTGEIYDECAERKS